MASGQTENYNLNQWEAGDKVLREEFNTDNARIDGALGTFAIQVAQKAEQTDLDDLSEATLKLAMGTYIGDGKYGYAYPRSLDFSGTLGRAPKLLILQESASAGLDAAVLFYGMTRNGSITWSGTSVSWYASVPSEMFNSKDVSYSYWAIG